MVWLQSKFFRTCVRYNASCIGVTAGDSGVFVRGEEGKTPLVIICQFYCCFVLCLYLISLEMFIHSSIYVFINLCINLFIYLSIYLSVYCLFTSWLDWLFGGNIMQTLGTCGPNSPPLQNITATPRVSRNIFQYSLTLIREVERASRIFFILHSFLHLQKYSGLEMWEPVTVVYSKSNVDLPQSVYKSKRLISCNS